MTSLLLAHLSDTHVGYRAYRAVAPSGRNQREEDFVRAFHQACDDIIARDVPLVVHSGDVADTPTISYRLVRELRDGFRRLAGVRPDGTRRQVVVVAGNHDLPGSRHETCFLELLDDLPGLHVVTGEYRRIDLAEAAASGEADPALENVVIHAIDHDSLATVPFDQVLPLPGRVNILLTHGTAGGTELYRRCVGREYTIPLEVLGRPWSYGALGHWHKQGPVALEDAATFARLDPLRRGRIWYAGSTENSGLGDLADGGSERGYMLVRLDTVQPDALPEVEPVMLPIRSMHRLGDLDATGMQAHEVQQALTAQLRELDATIGLSGAVVAQRVTGCDRTLWSLVDVAAVRSVAARALHHDLRLVTSPASSEGHGAGEPSATSTDVEAEIDAAAGRLLPAAQRKSVAGRAKRHLRRRQGADVVETGDGESGRAGAGEPEPGDEDAHGEDAHDGATTDTMSAPQQVPAGAEGATLTA